ncbi:MAG: CRISPR-associated endonuclease Cas2 [Opitutales bacterium]
MSAFRMGWLMAMFDLPVGLDEERREATRFRKSLLDDGFMMIQFSVYARPCVSLERLEKHYKRVSLFAPKTGNVRLLFFTDKQWAQTKLLSMPNKKQKKVENVPEQIEFW